MPSADLHSSSLTSNDGLPSLSRLQSVYESRSLKAFARRVWPIIEPGTPLRWNWHHDLLCEVLEDVTKGHIDRLIINIPPGMTKSILVSAIWPAWEWARNPGLRYLTASYTDANTIRDNQRCRQIVTSEYYQSNFSLRLREDQNVKVRYDTTKAGWRIASSVSGRGTGEHPDRIIIDDPLKAKDALSKTKLQAVKDWWKGTISTRVNRNPAIVIIMQRLHEEDLSGYLLDKSDDWHHVLLPMEYETPSSDPKSSQGKWDCPCHKNGPDPRDPRTKPGELLWPELYPEEKVKSMQLDLDDIGASGQLQQRPVPYEGGIFKREWFIIVDEAPSDIDVVYRGWDTGGTETGDDTAGVKMCRVLDPRGNPTFYVLDVVKEKVEEDGVDALIKYAALDDGKECRIREEKEPGSSGLAVVKVRSRSLAGYDYEWVTIDNNKITRSRPFRAQCQAGNVRLVKGHWNRAYIQELCAFPVAKEDNQVDASSCAFNAMQSEDDGLIEVELGWGGGN